jgi:lipid-A-disaccharide synthase
MLEASRNFPDYQFVVAKAPGLEAGFYDQLMQPYSNVAAVSNKTYSILSKASAALVTSGTATLETALFKVPEVVCYKGSPISYAIAKRILKIKYISLVNLIMDREVVKELIQDELTVPNLTNSLNSLLHNSELTTQLKADYNKLHEKLSAEGAPSERAAATILQFMGIKTS